MEDNGLSLEKVRPYLEPADPMGTGPNRGIFGDENLMIPLGEFSRLSVLGDVG